MAVRGRYQYRPSKSQAPQYGSGDVIRFPKIPFRPIRGKSDPRGPYAFLSNHSITPFSVDGVTYKSVEHYYQSHKFEDDAYKKSIINATTVQEAHRLGRSRAKRIVSNWEEIKVEVMWRALTAKFSVPKLKKALLRTGSARVPGGCNELGRLLMLIRRQLSSNSALEYKEGSFNIAIKEESRDYLQIAWNAMETYKGSVQVIEPKGKTEVRVMSDNVHFFCQPIKRKPTGRGAPKGHWLSNVIGVLKLVKTVDPDVQFIQEGKMNKQFEDGMRGMGYKYSTKSHVSLNMFNAAYSKTPFVYNGEVQFALDPIKREKRSAVEVVMSAGESKKVIRMFGAHLDVYDDTEKTRLAQVKDVQNAIQKTSRDSDMTLFLGDFNSLRYKDHTEEEWNTIKRSYKMRNCTPTSLVTNHLEKSGWVDCFVAKNNIPPFTCWNGTRVDYAYVDCTSSMKVDNVARCFVAHSRSSDHAAIVVDIKTD